MNSDAVVPHSRSVFSVLLSERPPHGYALYDVELVGVRQSLTGKISGTAQFVECAGQRIEMACHPATSPAHIGQIGCLAPNWEPIDAPGCVFIPYPDQTLRRAVELDAPDSHALRDGRRPDVVGWRCDAEPQGFRAPAGLVPGLDGKFVSDDSMAVVLRAPRELGLLARDHCLSAEDVLRAFMADLCGLRSTSICPRADGLNSSGSDERDLADQWFQRAFGHRYLDRETQTEHALEEAESVFEDPIGELLADFQNAGGSDAEVITALRALIAAHQATGKE